MPKRKLAASAVVFDDSGRVLLVKQGRRRHDWELPGGRVKKREPVTDAVVREVREETGLAVAPERLIGVFDIPKEAFCDFVFVCRPTGADETPRPRQPEIAECGFWPTGALPRPMRDFTAQRIRDALDGRTHALPLTLKPREWVG